MRKIATIERIGSSTRIEGSRLTDREVAHLLSGLAITAFATHDEQEVAGHAEVVETVFASWRDIALTENLHNQLHRDLLRHSVKDERHRGEYKAISNNVGAFDADGNLIGIVFETASPCDTPGRMRELMAWLRDARETAELHPLLTIAVFTVTFLAIHPLQAGFASVPYSSLESVIERSKEANYMRTENG